MGFDSWTNQLFLIQLSIFQDDAFRHNIILGMASQHRQHLNRYLTDHKTGKTSRADSASVGKTSSAVSVHRGKTVASERR